MSIAAKPKGLETHFHPFCESQEDEILFSQLNDQFMVILKSATIIQYTIKGRFMSR